MSKEVKHAVIEQATHLAGYDLADFQGPTGDDRDMRYAISLARWILADHANDAENALPLTAEILLASGFKHNGGYWFYHPNSPGVRAPTDGKTWFVGDSKGYIETVGDLRKLTEALHVPAVVVVPKGYEVAT